MRPASTFTAVAAVEAWDAWFRWRDARGLHDRTIESTWWRVARAVGAAEGAQHEAWEQRFVDAFGQWRLLPDERLLRHAGTGQRVDAGDGLRAAVNLAAFVAPRGARLECDRLADTAALAVRLLDDARPCVCPSGSDAGAVRIGLIGVADALEALGIDYDSPRATQQAAHAAAALAQGCLRGAVELARERGGRRLDPAQLQRLEARGTDRALLEDGRRWGLRFNALTAIEPQPRLALLANTASDALDPRRGNDGAQTGAGLAAQVRLRGAMQPWIDRPIDYALVADETVAEGELQDLAALTIEQGLAPMRVRLAGAEAPV
jgi:ribonucleoside-diphosphate reductase alpha chain